MSVTKGILKYIFAFVIVYLAIVSGEVTGADLLGDFDEHALKRAYKVEFSAIAINVFCDFYNRRRTKRINEVDEHSDSSEDSHVLRDPNISDTWASVNLDLFMVNGSFFKLIIYANSLLQIDPVFRAEVKLLKHYGKGSTEWQY